MNSAVLLFLLLLPGLAVATTLRQALDAASARAWSLRGLEAGHQEALARRTAVDRVFPGAPLLGLGQREGEGGKRETELEWATPLWLPGQRQASLALADARLEENAAALVARRWSLAGELRGRVAAAHGARAERDLARARLDSDRSLAEEVARRVAAGDLARADLLLARGGTLVSESALLEAETRLERALREYRLLTGLEVLPDAEEVAATSGGLAEHPALWLARRNLELARAGLELARRTRREAPELGMQLQRARDAGAMDYQGSVRFGLRIPFADEVRNRPLLVAAEGELTRAEAQLAWAKAEIEAEWQGAQSELSNAERARELAGERRRAASERLSLLRRGFELGELPLAQLLLARGQADESAAALVRAELQAAAARARLNQASGVLP